MGSVKIDVNAEERTYTQAYALSTPDGVKSLLRDRHRIGEATKSTLHSAIESAGLNADQTLAIGCLYGLGADISALAQKVGVKVAEIERWRDEGCAVIAAWFHRKGITEVRT